MCLCFICSFQIFSQQKPGIIMAELLEGEDLVKSLKQLVISFGPYIREAGSAEQAEELLLHMEESDENFHR